MSRKEGNSCEIYLPDCMAAYTRGLESSPEPLWGIKNLVNLFQVTKLIHTSFIL
jgi:hypothetical protein